MKNFIAMVIGFISKVLLGVAIGYIAIEVMVNGVDMYSLEYPWLAAIYFVVSIIGWAVEYFLKKKD